MITVWWQTNALKVIVTWKGFLVLCRGLLAGFHCKKIYNPISETDKKNLIFCSLIKHVKKCISKRKIWYILLQKKRTLRKCRSFILECWSREISFVHYFRTWQSSGFFLCMGGGGFEFVTRNDQIAAIWDHRVL